MIIHPFLLKVLNYVKKSNSSSLKIQISDLKLAKNLNKNEKRLLMKLIENGSTINLCYYNDNGNVESLYIDSFYDYPEPLDFPFIEHLSFFKSISSDFEYLRKMSSLRILQLKRQRLTKIPDLSTLFKLERLSLSFNELKEVNWFGDLPYLASDSRVE